MGKKAKLKKIRKLATRLPEVKMGVMQGRKVTGEEVIAQGVKEVDGKPVNAKGTYREKVKVAVPINHNRNMKRLYNQYGAAGVNGYIQAVQRHVSAERVMKQRAITEKINSEAKQPHDPEGTHSVR